MKTKTALILFGISILFFSGLFLSCATTPAGPPPLTNVYGDIANGTATGSGRGFGGALTVTLTVTDGFISSVEVDAARETAGFAAPVVSRAQTDMIRTNTPEIDRVAGATVTTNAVNEAARAALEQILAAR